jgi:hypothetical protein
MLRTIKTVRRKAGLSLALLYAFCILLPTVAFSASGAPAHCLTQADAAHMHKRVAESVAHVHGEGAAHSHGADASAHGHADAAAPRNDADTGSGTRASNCCGLFCITGLSLEFPQFVSTFVQRTHAVAALADVLIGRAPDRINRPPIR